MNQEKITKQFSILSKKDIRVDSLGLGGSSKSSNKDEFSDIDFFILVKHDLISSYVNDLQHTVHTLWPISIDFCLKEKQGFGYRRYWIILDNLLRVEFNIDSESTLKPHPFRKHTRISFDKTGFYTKFIKHNQKSHFCIELESQRVLKEFAFACDKVYVSLGRNHLWATIFYLERLKHLLFQIIRLRNGDLYWPERPFKNFENDFPDSLTNDLQNCLPIYEKHSIWNSFKMITNQFIKEINEINTSSQKPIEMTKQQLIIEKWVKKSKPR